MSSRDGGSFRQPGGNGGAPSAAASHNNNNNNGVKFAGEESKDKMYEPKHTKKLVRVLTVVAYIFSVSLAAIMLSVYYVFLWQPRDQRAHAFRVVTTPAPPAVNVSAAPPPAPAPAPSPDQAAAPACECPPPLPQHDGAAPTLPGPPPPPAQPPQPAQPTHPAQPAPPAPPAPQAPHQTHQPHQPHQPHPLHQQQQLSHTHPQHLAPPHPAPAPAPDEISTSDLDKQQMATTESPGRANSPVEGHVKSKQQMTENPRASREGQRLHFRSFQNALQV